MAYCTATDIENAITEEKLVQLTDDDKNGVPDAAVVEAAIADADTIIDAYYQAHYSASTGVTSKLKKYRSLDITIYRLYSRFGAIPDAVEDRYQRAMEMLGFVAAGSLDDPDLTADDPNSDRVKSHIIYQPADGETDDELERLDG